MDAFEFQTPPEAPVFTPSEEEFKDPLAFIAKIRPVGEKHGIVKIKPPPSWQPPFAINIDQFEFTPRLQRLNELEARSRVRCNFLDSIATFWNLQGKDVKNPMVDGRSIDLYLLYKMVAEAGGFEEVCAQKMWATMAINLGLKSVNGAAVRSHYRRLLYPYYIYKSGQAEEHVKSGQSPVKKQPKAPPEPPPPTAASTRSRRKPPARGVKLEEFSKGENKEDSRGVVSREMKRLKFYGDPGPRLGQEGDEVISQENQDADMKKETVKEEDPEIFNVFKSESDPMASILCNICKTGTNEEKLLMCDSCDESYHTFCLLPPLSSVPKGDWRCPRCVTAEVQKPSQAYGFETSARSYTLHSFGEMADNFKREYFKMPCHLVPCSTVEREFWRLVVNCTENVTVSYGADLLSDIVGSGFPQIKRGCATPEDEVYAKSPWNLNNLPQLPNSVLSHFKTPISGMKVPWVYVGMCFSTFCWHTEDHWSYSINYLHWGEPKTWYGIPSEDADKFEEVMQREAPELFKQHPDLLHHIVTIINPQDLMNAGVRVCTMNQCAGEFMITFPRAYHAGFNQGYNFAEAVNFCPSDWLSMGRSCMDHYAAMARACVFSHDELICRMASEATELDITTAIAAYRDMLAMAERERRQRMGLKEFGIKVASKDFLEYKDDDERQCAICKTTCFLSAITCAKCSDRLVCPEHVEKLCECGPGSYSLKYRYTMDELPSMIRALKSRSDTYDLWMERVNDALEAKKLDLKRPTLADLKNLLEEAKAERFPSSRLTEALLATIKHAERCSSLSNQLISQKMRTRNKQAGTANYSKKLKLQEVEIFYQQLCNLACRIPEEENIREFIEKVNAFRAEAASAVATVESVLMEHLKKLFDQAINFDLQLEEIAVLRDELERRQWAANVLDKLAQSSRTKSSPEKKHETTLPEARILLAEGVNLRQPVGKAVEAALATLQQALVKAEAREDKASKLFDGESRCSLAEAEVFLAAETEPVPLATPHFDALKAAFDEGLEWLRDYGKVKEHAISLSDLEQLSQVSRPIQIDLGPERDGVEGTFDLLADTLDQLETMLMREESRFDFLEILLPRQDLAAVKDGSISERLPVKRANNGNLGWLQQFDSVDELNEFISKLETNEVGLMQEIRARNELKDPKEGSVCICRPSTSKGRPLTIQCVACGETFHLPCIEGGYGGQIVTCGTAWRCERCGRSNRPALARVEPLITTLLSNSRIITLEAVLLERFLKRATDFRDVAREFISGSESAQPIDYLYARGCLLEVSLPEFQAVSHMYLAEHPVNSVFVADWKKSQRAVPPSSSRPDRRKRAAPAPVAKAEPRKPKNAKKDEESCSAAECLLPTSESVVWVQCEGGCQAWFHILCVGITPDSVERIGKYRCFRCDPRRA